MDRNQMIADNLKKKNELSRQTLITFREMWPKLENSRSPEEKELYKIIGMIDKHINNHKENQKFLSGYNLPLKYQEFGYEYGETLEELENNKERLSTKLESIRSPEEKDYEKKHAVNLYVEKVRENIEKYLNGNYRDYSDLPFFPAQYNLAKTISEMSDPVEKRKYITLYLEPFKDWEQDLIDKDVLSHQATTEKQK